MSVVVRSRLLTSESANTIGMYVPKSPTEPESSDHMLVFSFKLDERRRHLFWWRRSGVVVDISGCSFERVCDMLSCCLHFQISMLIVTNTNLSTILYFLGELLVLYCIV